MTMPKTVFAVRQIEQGARRELAKLFWGLIPSWAKDNKGAYACINARSDSVATKPTFRSAFKKRRCLVLADGYYEWRKEGKIKQPYFFEVDGGQPFAFAGLTLHCAAAESFEALSKRLATMVASVYTRYRRVGSDCSTSMPGV